MVLWVSLYVQNKNGQFQPKPIKSVTLNTTNTNQNGADILLTNSDVTVHTLTNEWYIDTTTQNGFNLGIFLDSSWGFHPTKVSGITFTVYSPTIITTVNKDLIVVFSVNNNQFISLFMSLDTSTHTIGPPTTCNKTPTPTQVLGTGDIKTCVDQQECSMNGCSTDCHYRQSKIWINSNGESNQYAYFKPTSISSKDQFPLIFTIINDPINDYSFIRNTNPSYHTNIYQQCGYNAFDTNSGLQIYIALDDDDETISLSQFDIAYFYNVTSEPTLNPTEQPTHMPSQMPSNIPSVMPSSIPSNSPTYYPSLLPSTIPSTVPSTIPSGIPSNVPSNIPSIRPSVSTKPSMYPTISPSNDSFIESTMSVDIQTSALTLSGSNNGIDSSYIILIICCIIFICLTLISVFAKYKKSKSKANQNIRNELTEKLLKTENVIRSQQIVTDGIDDIDDNVINIKHNKVVNIQHNYVDGIEMHHTTSMYIDSDLSDSSSDNEQVTTKG